MALDGLFMRQITKEIKDLLPLKINKIQQVSDTEILFHLRGSKKTYRFMISAHSVYNRMNITEETYTTPEVPGNFIMLLRKHLDGGMILEFEQIGLDRIVHMLIEARNELGDKHLKHLYIELMGKYANVILVNEDYRIIDALKRIPPFENSKRTIHPGANFVLPEGQTGKQDPYNYESMNEEESFVKQFHGFSPLLSKEVQYRMHKGETFDQIMHLISDSNSLYLSEKDNKDYFHCIPLTHLEVSYREYPLMKGIDALYYHKEERERIRQQSGDIFKVVRKELAKNKTKLPKLQSALDEAMDLDKYREYGDLLFAYQYQLKDVRDKVILPSFETGEDIEIKLDPRFDIKTNANRYYHLYHKLKNAQVKIKEQIELCEKEIDYFELMEEQLEMASFLDAQEIRNELSQQGYMKAVQSKIRKKKKNVLPNFMTLQFEDGTRLYLGKNNLQNDYVTFKLAKKQDTWFHSKDLHGSHVVVTGDNLSEQIIRDASMLAAYYSKGRLSSSVPVNYCQIRQLKKVPGSKSGFVTLTNYKTIYIDPDSDYIEKLIEKYIVK